MISCRSRPGRSGIADVADVPAILVGDESDIGAVVVPVVVPDVVEGDCRGYRLPSGRHRHCPGTAAAGLRRPSGGSSAATDRAAVVRRLGFGLSWTDFPKAGPHYLLWRWVTCDEDIATLNMHELASSPSYKSTPTRFSRSSRIQPTPLHGFGDISLIWSPNEVILDALES